MNNVVTNCNCTTEANILSKYGNTFPESFVECVRQGCTWLASHNNITYQTSTLVRTDAMVYSNSGSSVLKIGLIDVDRPTTGLTQYDVISVKETKDLINGCTVYTIKAAYKTPMGIELTFIPIKYFDPKKPNPTEYYTVEQVDGLLKVIQEQLDEFKVSSKEQLNEALSEYVLTSQHDQDIAVLNKRIDNAQIGQDQNNTTFLTPEKAEELYLKKDALDTYAKTADVEAKFQTEQTTVTDLIRDNTENAIRKQNYAKGMFLNTGDYVIYNNKLYQAKQPFMVSGTFATDESKLFNVTDSQNAQQVTAVDVANLLKADDTFKASIKGETGEAGPQGPAVDTSDLATKTELSSYVKTTKLTTELKKKVDTTDFEAYKGTVYTKEEADNAFEPKTT